MAQIRTAHLLLRRFTSTDEAAWARAVLGNPVTMRALPAGKPAPRQRAAGILADFDEHWRRHGHGMWAVEHCARGALIGHCGLQRVDGGQRVELVVALCPPHSRGNLPQEAAQAALRHGFESLRLPEAMAVVLPANGRARRLWRQLGMRHRGSAHLYDQRLPLFTLRREDFVHHDERYELHEEEALP